MNSPFVAIVPLYALVLRRTVYEAGIGSLILQGWSVYYHTYVAACVVTHNGVDPGTAIVTRPSQWRQVFDYFPKPSNQFHLGNTLLIPLLFEWIRSYVFKLMTNDERPFCESVATKNEIG